MVQKATFETDLVLNFEKNAKMSDAIITVSKLKGAIASLKLPFMKGL